MKEKNSNSLVSQKVKGIPNKLCTKADLVKHHFSKNNTLTNDKIN